jgi:hypothetical protein
MDVLKFFGEDDVKVTTQLINNMYGSGEWPKNFNEVTMNALKKKPNATKCTNHHTVSLFTHTAKTLERKLKRIERTFEDVLGEDQFGFRCSEGTRDAIGMLRIVSEQTL